ncbi:MAG TPA: stage II sporulation protein M [Actinomycetes bacterium]|nr:stage II sporulation protein M [Actinomycetes bacterium]
MDVDAYVAAHRDEWTRLEALLRRGRRLTPAEVDEMVALYQRAATHLSAVRSASPDPALVTRLSALVARARAAVTGAPTPAWREVARFVVEVFPVTVYRARRWIVATAVGWLAVAAVVATWVATSPSVQQQIATPEEVRRLVEVDFEGYYSAHPAAAFAAQVWTNNAWIAAAALAFGVLLGLPVLWLLWQNAANVAVAAGLMAAHDRLGLFFGLITPHGLLELTAVFVAAGLGLRLGWTVIDPGGRPRSVALAAEGRTTLSAALGLVVVLAVSGAVEAFVTPSGLPTWARITIGALVWGLFVAYVAVLGRRGVAAGLTGDLRPVERGEVAPYVA